MEDRCAFPAELSSAAQARRHAERVLADWRLDEVSEVARLLVSEVVVNAVLHAGTEGEMVLRFDGDRLRVEVNDGSTAVPSVRRYTPQDPTGRGLLILDELADSWGVDVGSEGKTVWFELVVGPGAGHAGAARSAGGRVAGDG